ncbi:hypothetical protein WR25_23383 [Diploscapter pachys]|uniref:FiLamiN (Actin binding protein) homolog n=1 Tax=Diploscapter pachys TaxID=2018661 RepID=A0A2A2KS67_9BILA|nr:hypothetical protein WR25_23383 [Diploscapter pachys]
MPLSKPSDVSLVSFSGLTEPCCVGSIVEVVINAHGEVPSGSVYVEAVSPSGKSNACNVQINGASYMATFVPVEVGTWRIGILYEGEHIRGSPFVCEVFDPSLVNVYGLDVGLVGQELRFTVNASQAGHGNIKVTVLRHGREIPSSIEEINNSQVYRVTFIPDGAGQYRIHVLQNRMEIKGSPFILDIADASSVSVYGENLKMASVERSATFMVHAVGADTRDITVHVTAPSGKVAPATVTGVDSVTFKAEWNPSEAGEHTIDVRLAGQSVAESPFLCNVGAPELVHVRNMPRRIGNAQLNEECTFEIDASAAGSGNLEIMINGGRVPCRVKELGSRQYLAIFTPTQSVTHTVEMKFNGEAIAGSPWKLPVEDREDRRKSDKTMSYYSELSGPGLVRAPINRTSSFDIAGDGLELADIQAKIYGPDGREYPVRIIPRGAGKYTAEYRIEQVGEHLLTVWIAGRKVDGSPLSVAGYATERVRIEPLGGGTPQQPVQFVAAMSDVKHRRADTDSDEGVAGMMGSPNPHNSEIPQVSENPPEFDLVEERRTKKISYYSQLYVVPAVDAVDAGKGQLEISVNQGRGPNNVQMQGAGRCLVTFIPQHPGTYVIDVTFNGEQVHGCPIKVEILPKQVGSTVQANLTPTAVSTAISAGSGANIAGAFRTGGHTSRSPASPTSPTLLRDSVPYTSHARQRSEESMLRSPTLLRESRVNSKPWQTSYAPASSRLSSSLSPNRWNATSAYSDYNRSGYGGDIDRTLSPTGGEARTQNIRESTTIIRRTPSPTGIQSRQIHTETIIRRSPTPPYTSGGVRTREFAERITPRSPSPVRYTSTYQSREERTYRSPSPRLYDEVARTTSPHYIRSPSPPTIGERVKRIERIDPLTEETERERRRVETSFPVERDRQTVGYTVAQYGSPSTTEKRYFGDTLERSERSYAEDSARATSPEYSQVYERYERKPHEVGGYKSPIHHRPEAARSPTPPPDYDNKPDTHYVTSYLKYSGPKLVQESDTKTTTYSTPTRTYQDSPTRPHYDSIERRPTTPEGRIERAEDLPETRMMSSERDFDVIRKESEKSHEPSFLRTQSEKTFEDQHDRLPLHRTEEKESVYDMPPPTEPLHRSTELGKTPLGEAESRAAEMMRVKEEDDRILSKHSFFRSKKDDHHREKSPEKYEKHSEKLVDKPHSPIISERQVTETYQDVRDGGRNDGRDIRDSSYVSSEHDRLTETPIQTLQRAGELPHSPAPSMPTTPSATPKTATKFKKEKDSKEMKEAALMGTKPFDFGKSKFSAKHEVIKRGKEVEVKLENLKLGKEDVLRVVVQPPLKGQNAMAQNGQSHPPELEHRVKKSGSKYEIIFKPTEVGTHKIFAYVNEIQHPQSPFNIRIYDASEMIVGEIPKQSYLNDTVEFTVDAGRAGFGNLEMAIKDADGVIIPSHVAQLETGTAKFLVTFTPATKGPHTVNITFNKEVLKNSPFEVNIIDPPAVPGETPVSPTLSKKDMKIQEKERKKEEKERVKREKEEKAATLKKEKKSKKYASKTAVTKIPSLSRVGEPSSLLIDVSGQDQLEVHVLDSRKNEIGTELVEVEPGVMQINFTPQHVGDHEIEVKYGGHPVTGSPFTCRAYDPTRIKVGNIPKGLLEKPVYFTVDASEAGVGNLEVAVNEGRVPSMAHALGQHRYDISFVPKENVDHNITVRFNNEPVPGSPFVCKLVTAAQASASGPGLERIPVDEVTEIQIHSDTGASTDTPSVRIRDPQSHDLPVNVTRSRNNETLHIATYTPKAVGNHTIDISVNGEPIAGSPFTAKAYDSRQCRLSPCDRAEVGKPATFTIDAAKAGAGNMEIIVSVDNRNVPNFVQAEGQAKFKVSFTPQEAKEHVISVRFNGISVPGSPMKCHVESAGTFIPATTAAAPVLACELTKQSAGLTEIQPTTALGRELKNAQVGQKKGFTVENPSGKAHECNVIITAPDGSRLPATVSKDTKSDDKNDKFAIFFTPTTRGTHLINIYVDDEKLTQKPIEMFVAEKASLPSTALVGKKHSFDVDAKTKDNVRVDIRDSSGKNLPVQLEDLSEGGVRATCRFKQPGHHSIDVFVNDQVVGDRTFTNVLDPINGAQLITETKREIVGQQTELKLLVDSGLENEVKVEIEGPDRQSNAVQLKKISETLWGVSWTPMVEGDHQLSIYVAGDPIPGSPFVIPVLDPSAVRVIGLKNDRVGVEQKFNVDYTTSGANSASVEISCGSDATIPVTVKKVKPGLLICTFTPTKSGPHRVDVKIDGLLLPECPYECFISAEGTVKASGDALKRAQRGRTARFEVALNDKTKGELDVNISDPKGGPLPVRCYKQQDESYWVEFTPEQTGTHTIEVTFGDMPVAGSPFRCEVVDPRRVAVRGLPDQLTLRHATAFKVDRRDAGLGELQVEVQDPNGSPVRIETLKSPSGEQTVTFLPNKLGPHKVNVKLAGFQLPGYPQTLQSGEQEKPAVYGAAIDQSIKIGEPASLLFDPKKAAGGLKINVTSPNGEKIRHNVMRRPNGTSEVVFYPEEVGNYKMSVEFNNKAVSGSPYTVRVVDPSKVIVNDLDMDRDGSFLLRLGQSNTFDVDATAAGPGKLRTEVRDADGTLVTGDGPAVEDLGGGKYRVRFVPQRPGRYSIYLYWNELPVESAFPVRARSAQEDMPTTSRDVHREVHAQRTTDMIGSRDRDVRDTHTSSHQRDSAEIREARDTVGPLAHARDKSSSSSLSEDIGRVMLRGDGLHRATLNQPNEFIIDGGDLHKEGRITATLLGSKADIPVRVQQLNYNVFKATYTPLTPGTYELHVLWNGKHVKGSPFKVVADTSSSPADNIGVDASTLKIGIINEDIKTVIDTRRAGPGQLSAHCMGPNQPAYCELYDHRDGTYTLCIRPAEVGKHTLVIKYNDEHVRGSPFVVHVSLPPDPSKVRVYGPGVEHGILSLFKSNFVVETRGAGAGQLTVRVRGPKGAFNVEMQREKRNERTIHCKYEPKEPGDYQVEVKWHGEHVPGSPFLVMIVDTEQELQRFLRGEAPSPIPSTPFIPPGWVGPPPMMGPPPGNAGPRPPFPPMMGAPPPGAIPYGAPMPPRHKARHY